MMTIRRSFVTLLIVLLSLVAANGQTPAGPAPELPSPDAPTTTPNSSVIVTATATTRQVRSVSIGEVHQTRLQVFSTDGTQVYDSGLRLGNLVEWQLHGQQGATIADGTYLFLVTAKGFSGRLTQKYGTANLEQGQVYLEQGSRDALAPAQTAALEANKLSEALRR